MLRALGIATLLALAPTLAEDLDTERLIARENARAAMEQAIELLSEAAAAKGDMIAATERATDLLLPHGDAVVPFLSFEIERKDPGSFYFSAYVLGRLRSAEAETVLRRAFQEADEVPGDWAIVRKAWAGWALGLHGRLDVLDAFDAGNHKTSNHAIHADTSVLESAALLTAPASLPVLLEQLERHARDAVDPRFRVPTLRALRRIGDPSAAPRLIEILLEDPETLVRAEAARTLGTLRAEGVAQALFSALGDPHDGLRGSVAQALNELRPLGATERIIERLTSEKDRVVRRLLIRLLGSQADDPSRLALRTLWQSGDTVQRAFVAEAAGLAGDLAPLVEALASGGGPVALRAAPALGSVRTEQAVDALIDAIPRADATLLQTLLYELTRRGATRAAPQIAERLIGNELAGRVTDRQTHLPIEKMLEALVALRYTKVVPRLEKALAGQDNTTLLVRIEPQVEQLRWLARYGKKRAGWIRAVTSDDPELRTLAVARLGEIGGAQAVRTLVERFPDAPADEAGAILYAVGNLDSAAGRKLIEHVLLSADFDGERVGLRDIAAWSARRIGGPEMGRLLERAVRRREGLDARVLIYAAMLGGRDALPLVREFRLQRLYRMNSQAGLELEVLDRIARRLETDRPVDEWDRPPRDLFFR